MCKPANADSEIFEKKPLLEEGAWERPEITLLYPSFLVADEHDDGKDGHGNSYEGHVVHWLSLSTWSLLGKGALSWPFGGLAVVGLISFYVFLVSRGWEANKHQEKLQTTSHM